MAGRVAVLALRQNSLHLQDDEQRARLFVASRRFGASLPSSACCSGQGTGP